MTTAISMIPTSAILRLVEFPNHAASVETRAMIRSNPAGALAILSDREGNQLSLWQSANLLDEIVGQIQDPLAAADLIRGHVSDGYLEEMLAVRGDLPASAVEVVDVERLIGAMLRDIGVGELDVPARALVFMVWSLKAKDRADWDELKEVEIDGLTVTDLILLALQSEFNDLTPDVFETHGLDCIEGRQRLRELRRERAGLDQIDVERARKALGKLAEVAERDDQLGSLASAAAAAVVAAAEEDE